MEWETVRSNWAVIWAGLLSGINIIHLLLVKTYDSRMSALEKAIDGMPSRQELHQLQLDMSNLRGEIREFSGMLRQATRISDLLLENELKEKN